jgi:fibro-slime domain-containing protein
MFRIFKNNWRGNILILIIAFGWISLAIILGLVSYAISENRASKYKLNREEAVQIAEAGIAYYRWHLAHNNNDFKDGTSENGPYVHEYRNKDGKLIGYYSLTIISPENGSTIVTIFSTGWLVDQPDSKRTLKVRLGFPAISDYAFLVDSDLIFSNTAFVHGKTHANGRISFNGTSDAPISSAIEITGSGGPKSYWLFPVPRKDLASVSVKLAEIKTKAQTNGLNWPYLPASGAYGYQLTFRADGMVDVSKVISAPACFSGSCYDATDFSAPTAYEIPTSSYIFVDDAIWVNGVVKGRATLATMGNDIVINGNLAYLAKDGMNVLGLMTDSNILFPYNVPDPMEVDAALLTVNGTIFRPKYIDNGVGSKDIINLQNFYGSRVSNFSGGMKYLGCGSICSGFLNTNYTYDANLTYRPPAGFPVGSTYNLISWEEVREVTTTGSDFIPVSDIQITPSSATVPANTSFQFTATALPANATIKNILWSVFGGDQNGRITANGLYTAPDTAGTMTVIAQSGGVIATVQVTVTSNGNAPPTIQTSPAANPSAVAGQTAILSVLGHDDGGEANLHYTWSTVLRPSGAANPTFSPNGTNPAKNTAVTFYKAGTYQFQVQITDNNGLSVTSPLVQVVVNQTLTNVLASPSPVVMAIDTTQQFSATTTDQFGQPMGANPTFTWSASSGSVTSGGVYTPAAVGAWTVTASTAGKSGNAVVSVTEPAAAPTIARETTLATGNDPTTPTFNVNANQVVIVLGGGNKNPGAANTGNFYISRTASGGTLNCSQVGTIANTQTGAVGIWECIPTANLTNVTVRIRSSNTTYDFVKAVIFDGASATLGTFNKSYGSGAPSLTINASSAKSLVLSVGYDTNFPGGSPVLNQTVLNTWVSAGNDEAFLQRTTNPTSNPGNISFTRTSPNSGAWNMAGVEVKSAGPGTLPPTIAVPAAASPSTVTKTTTTLSVLGDDDGGEVNLTYTWSVGSKPTGAPDPTFATANNTNAAKNNVVTFYQSGSYQFQATIRDQSGNAITSATITVTVNQTLATISLAPIDPNLAAAGAPQQFTATSSDQFGSPMLNNPAYSWSTTRGSITAAGLYTPPGTIGSAVVSAASASVTGTSNVTISASGGGGPNCTSGECIQICGDGVIEPGEECDDGNIVSNDGCSATCVSENLPGVTCTNITSIPPDTLPVPIVLRDFKGWYETPSNVAPDHPDFESYMCDRASKGLVQTQLVGGKPVFARSTAYPTNSCGTQLTGANYFSMWYTNTSTYNKTVNDVLTLRLVGTSPTTYEYDSSLEPLGNTTNTTQLGFFPLDDIPTPSSWGKTPAGGGLNHNFAFTTEMHYWFTYQGGEVLSFSGDDDVWVFINGKLALDLGGLHPRVDGSITLSGTLANTLGLVSGGAYEIALFHAERHTTQSNFKLTLVGFVKATTQCISVCGDGIPAPSEECDEGANNGIPNGICTIDCKLTGPVN